MAQTTTMDFFGAQDQARRKTSLLVAYYGMAVVAIIVAVYVAVVLILGVAESQSSSGVAPTAMDERLWQPDLFLIVAGITLLVVTGGTLFKVAQLARGGEAVAAMLGGRQVPGNSRDPDERRLLNIVQEVALASGVPVPQVFVMDHESGINAFAAGYEPGNAVVAVTRGCLQTLSRDELQGVIAHEFSHILNGDMRLNIRLMGVLHGILCIALIGYGILRTSSYRRTGSRSSREKGGGGIVLLGIALLVIGYIGVFFANLIKSAVSRQREFLADASAVQFTRNPDGLAGALRKIAQITAGSRIQAPQASEASHMFFSNALSSSFLSLLATHPPLMERIRRINPSFVPDGVAPVHAPNRASPPPPPSAAAAVSGLSSLSAGHAAVLNSVGAPSTEHLDIAAGLLAELPDSLRHAVGEPYGARAVVYAILLDKAPGVRAIQLEHLRRHADPHVCREVDALAPDVATMRPELRLPLADLAVPALRTLSPDQYRVFRTCVEALVGADDAVDLSEYALERILVRHLDSHFGKQARKVVQYYSLEPLLEDCVRLLACMAYWGADTQEDARRAFQAGIAVLPDSTSDMPPADACGLQMVDDALTRLDLLAMPLKRVVIDACTRCVLSDREVRVEEGDLLRAVADSLGCPMPPLLGNSRAQA